MTKKEAIKLDTKFLLRFLKENHLLKIFLFKFNNGKNIKAKFSYKEYLKFILRHKQYYHLFSDDLSLDDIINNKKLFLSAILFCDWFQPPIITTYEFEPKYFHEILNNFILFKKNYMYESN